MSVSLIEERRHGGKLKTHYIERKNVDGNCAIFLNRTVLTSILSGTLMGS